MDKFRNKSLVCLFIFIMSFTALRTDYFILSDFAHAPIPKADLVQYSNDWPSGRGVNEAVEFFEKEAQKQPIYIITQGTFGLMPHALEIYLIDNKNITIKGIWPVENTLPKNLQEISPNVPVYMVFYQPCGACSKTYEAPLDWKLEKVLQVKRENGTAFTVYKMPR